MSVITAAAEIVLAYAALALYIGVLMGAVNRRDWRLVGIVVIAPLVLLPLLRLTLAYELLLIAWILIASRFLTRGDIAGIVVPAAETKTAWLHLMLLTASAIFLVPLFWLLLTSLKTDDQLAQVPAHVLPVQQATISIAGHSYPRITVPVNGKPEAAGLVQSAPSGMSSYILAALPQQTGQIASLAIHPVYASAPDWRNYPQALKFLPPESHDGLTNLQNTLIIAILSVIGTVISSSLVAYAFARLRWPGKNILFGLVLATMMMPDAVTMMPRFLIFQHIHWYDTLKPLWVPAFFGSAFNIFLLRQFFMGIPTELEDAAKIDGCGYFSTWWRIMMPMVKPALVSVALLAFIASWKDFLGPLIYISSPEKMPVSYVLQLFSTAHNDHQGILMAATVMVILPIMLLFFFAQRYFVEGVTLTGLGGR